LAEAAGRVVVRPGREHAAVRHVVGRVRATERLQRVPAAGSVAQRREAEGPHRRLHHRAPLRREGFVEEAAPLGGVVEAGAAAPVAHRDGRSDKMRFYGFAKPPGLNKSQQV